MSPLPQISFHTRQSRLKTFFCCCLCISSSVSLKKGQKWSAWWFLDQKKCLLLLPQTPSSPVAAFEAQGYSGPWEWLCSFSVSQGSDLQILLVASCGISAELGFPKQTWVSHLMDLPRAGEVQSHCLFLNFRFLAEDVSARKVLLPKEEDLNTPKNVYLYLQVCTDPLI